ncbi:Holliday junction branch migration protein RuvA [Candidatus Roizmanbacteria bacterium CG_4_10_14_0_2_um_filter_36_35]|uniref:Holliday junction branch migration complex subunit RuvA n=4 Tax=Candidatus Roizmaniibacteriota TaxID=1752723 RepID=A0A2M7BXC2_9BACT|nr:MAG: Holliday junction branch migration protein RuvA [Candidatus Roizmanbacteria bacterium CG11_big_fil_rev_8_21_14_0_20_35_14]PIV11204.1 MAG: Holliday junction branch migration protein RuvA [Candidatus Roizmanbacteria bacterium CG03_land_8_20_14_0_80_35_26]PIZ66751.1 MAG: Holliday junction branch migration protein RuvA [Candidatus Roizmanbacteria bacterium CG_4_10_14_0_2_um_filter_36_35]PJC33223.1 MAG: Holliday junction branch migration protein RuvA [Candidatus Roizmanbacteria bacterium CG_4
MIGKLKGKLSEVSGNVGLIETAGGVFYEVFLTPFLISHIPPKSPIEIYTYLQVREDALVLFGFQTKQEYNFFKLLLTVSGVGPKTAFNIISFIKVEELIKAVKGNEVDSLTQIPGLGRKTAMKIILELSSKLKSEFDMKNMIVSEDDKIVVDALVSLGYKSHEARQMLAKLPKNLSVEEKIKKALKISTAKKY